MTGGISGTISQQVAVRRWKFAARRARLSTTAARHLACQTHARYRPRVRGKRGPSCAIPHSAVPECHTWAIPRQALHAGFDGAIRFSIQHDAVSYDVVFCRSSGLPLRWRRSADLSGVPPGGRLRFQRSRSRSCSSSSSLVRMVRASRSPLVRSANANRKSTAANEAVSIVKRGKRGYHTNGALLGRGMSRSIGPRGVWTGLAPSGRLSTPLTHMAGFIFWALTGRSEKDTARSARGSASRRDGPKSFFRCI